MRGLVLAVAIPVFWRISVMVTTCIEKSANRLLDVTHFYYESWHSRASRGLSNCTGLGSSGIRCLVLVAVFFSAGVGDVGVA